MILTFEVQDSEMDVHFDKEGRDILLSIVSKIGNAPDHYHLAMEPFGEISAKRFDADATAMRMVTFYMLEPDTAAAALEQVTYARARDGEDKAERVVEIGGVEQKQGDSES